MKRKFRIIFLSAVPLWGFLMILMHIYPFANHGASARAEENSFVLFEDMPEFQILKGKIVFDDAKSPDFSILAINRKPTLNEKKALLRWGEMRELNTSAETYLPNYSNRSEQVRRWADQWWYNAKVLTAALCSGKLTYGEFAQKRMDNFTFYSNKIMEYEAAIAAEQQRRYNAQVQQANYAAEQARIEKELKRAEGVRILQNLSNQLQQQEAQNNEIRRQQLRDAQRSFNEMQMLRIQQQRNNIIQGW